MVKKIILLKNTPINIISGHTDYAAEMKKGQILKVVGKQSGGWLRLKTIKHIKFKDFENRIVSSENIIFGISTIYQKEKFKLIGVKK